MSLFRCTNCGCVENTALSLYWMRKDFGNDGLCSECDPKIKKWHGRFPKESADEYMLLNDGFLVSEDYTKTHNFKWREEHQDLKIVGKVKDLFPKKIGV